MSIRDHNRQVAIFNRQGRWIVAEFKSQMRRRCCADRAQRLEELSVRARQLEHEYECFERQTGLARRKSK